MEIVKRKKRSKICGDANFQTTRVCTIRENSYVTCTYVYIYVYWKERGEKMKRSGKREEREGRRERGSVAEREGENGRWWGGQGK